MSSTWRQTQTQRPNDDPLKEFARRTVLGRRLPGSTSAKFVGRLTVELWDVAVGGAHGDAGGLMISVESADGRDQQLLKRVAVALTARVATMP
jgi:hypothetical protein